MSLLGRFHALTPHSQRYTLKVSIALLSIGHLWAGQTAAALADIDLNRPFILANQEPVLQAQAGGPSQLGNQVVLNGDLISLPWRVRGTQIGIPDYGLTQTLGAELLSSDTPTQQPIRWFSDPRAQPFLLDAWLEDGYRFLDISRLIQQQGGSLQVKGSALEISLPTGTLLGLRRGLQTWGDRIVLDLNTPVAWRLQERSGTFTLTLNAVGLPPTVAASVMAQEGNRLNALTVQSGAQTTTLQGQIDNDVRPLVFTLPNPPRLVVDIRPDSLDPKTIQWAPGLVWQQQYLSVNGRPFPVYWLEVNPQTPGLTLRPIWTDPLTATGIAPLITTAQRWQATAAINAGFFNRNNQYPLGAVQRDNTWISGPILNRGVIAWDDAGRVLIDRLFLNQTLTTEYGQSFPIKTINSGYPEVGISLYTPTWGRTYTPLTDNEVIVTVANGRVVGQQQAAQAGTIPISIPTDGYLLAIRALQSAAQALLPNTQLSIQTQPQPSAFQDYPQIIGAGPLLVKQGQIVLNAEAEGFSTSFATQAAVRSAIGVTPQGKLMLVTVHQSPTGRGITLAELAQLMIQMGSQDALNLDGGSSSSLYLGGRLINRDPSTAARVQNGIGLFLTPE